MRRGLRLISGVVPVTPLSGRDERRTTSLLYPGHCPGTFLSIFFVLWKIKEVAIRSVNYYRAESR